MEDEQSNLNMTDENDAPEASTLDDLLEESEETTTETTTTTRDPNFLYIVSPMANVTVSAGKEVRLRCNVKGHPPPRFRWFKNEAPFEPEKKGRITLRKDSDGSKIRIKNLDVPDTGYYRCEATNGFETVETTGILKVLMVPGRTPPPLDIEDEIEPDADYPEMSQMPEEEITDELTPDEIASISVRAPDIHAKGTCQVYKGIACAKFLKNATVFIGDSHTQTQVEESLMAAFAAIPKHTNELSSQCTEYAVPSLCYHMFPVCEEGSHSKQRPPRQMCKDECALLESEICRREYAIANGHPVLKQFMPDCTKLPTEQSSDQRKCLRLGLRPSVHSKVNREECYDGNGEAYAGMTHHTASGVECHKWNGVHYPDYAHHNYCRNPNGVQSRPWCINSQTDKVELCAIPKCVRPFEDVMNNWLLVMMACGGLIFFIALLSLLVCICRRRKRRSKERNESFKVNIKTNPLELHSLIPKYHIPVKVPEIQMSSVRLHNILGEGQMGKVFTGEVNMDGYSRPAVIRMLKEAANAKMKHEFHKELTLWSELRHPNVTALIGAHSDRDPLALVFEHSLIGDLHEYLEAMSDKGTQIFQTADFSVDYLNIASQVATGLEYLSSNNYVHKDVATRNCWVYENGNIKIADHGVGPSRYPMDYTLVQGHALSIRWMAPESLNFGQFTHASSVWSFGVLMWELWTEGTQPYYGYAYDEIVEMIRLRQLLPQPDDCPPSIYSLMVECWHENPVRRPSFKELQQRLWHWERSRSASSGQDHSHQGQSRSTVSQHSSSNGRESHSNNTGSTHISNGVHGFGINLPALPTSPMPIARFNSNSAPRKVGHTQTGSVLMIPPSPQVGRHHSAMNTPQFRGPRFTQNSAMNLDTFRTTNL